jgi:hypothetical protein
MADADNFVLYASVWTGSGDRSGFHAERNLNLMCLGYDDEYGLLPRVKHTIPGNTFSSPCSGPLHGVVLL